MGAAGTAADTAAATPVVQGPVSQEPESQRPVSQRPVSQRPVLQRPVLQRPVSQEPVPQRSAAPLVLPPGLQALPPLPYLDFLGLLARARLVATDSGGVQEEATALDLPCLTLRAGTERPVTLGLGTSRLVAPAALPTAVAAVLAGHWPRAQPIPLWDGQAGRRMAAHLAEVMGR